MSDILKERGRIEVRPLQSSLPFVGRIRNGVAGIAARWLVEDVVAQQNLFNGTIEVSRPSLPNTSLISTNKSHPSPNK